MRTVADRVSGCESGSIKKVSRRDSLPTLRPPLIWPRHPRLGSQRSAASRWRAAQLCSGASPMMLQPLYTEYNVGHYGA